MRVGLCTCACMCVGGGDMVCMGVGVKADRIKIVINSSAPAYLSDILHLYPPAGPLRSSADTRLLKLPLYKHKTKGDRAFSHFGPSVWYSVLRHMRNAAIITALKSALKTRFLACITRTISALFYLICA